MEKTSNMLPRMTITDRGRPVLLLLCPEELEENRFIEALSLALKIRQQRIEMEGELAELAGMAS